AARMRSPSSGAIGECTDLVLIITMLTTERSTDCDTWLASLPRKSIRPAESWSYIWRLRIESCAARCSDGGTRGRRPVFLFYTLPEGYSGSPSGAARAGVRGWALQSCHGDG